MKITLEQAEKDFVLKRRHGKIHIKKYIGKGGNVSVPEFIDGMPVTKIEQMAFFGSDITAAVIPRTVRYIGESAFCLCKSLKKVSFASKVFIRRNAFYISGLDEISGIGFIEGNELDAFGFKCTPFLENTETFILGNKLLWCRSETEVYTVPSDIRVIGYRAFADSKIRKIILQDGLKEIGSHAFICAETESLRIPDSVEKMGANAFWGCDSLNDLRLPKDFALRDGWSGELGLNVPVFDDTQLFADNNDDVLIYRDVSRIICKNTVYRERHKQREKQIFPQRLEYLKEPVLLAYAYVNVFRNDSFKVGDVKEVFNKELIFRFYCGDGRRRFRLIFDLNDSCAEVLLYFPVLPFIKNSDPQTDLIGFYNSCITNGKDGRFFDLDMYDGHILEQDIPFRIKAEIAFLRCTSNYRLTECARNIYRNYFEFHRKKLNRLLQKEGYGKLKEFFDEFLDKTE